MSVSFDEWVKALPPCKDCGKPMTAMVEKADLLECYRIQMRPNFERIWNSIAPIDFVCDPCCGIREGTEEKAIKASNARKHISKTYLAGLVSDDAAGKTFEKSLPLYEALNPRCWQTVREWTLTKPNLWLLGTTGMGKTHATHCVINRVLEMCLDAVEISALEIIKISNDFKAMHHVKPHLKAHLLVIQDIDKGIWTQNALDLLWYIIDQRSKRKRLMITSNLSPEEIKRAWEYNAKNPSTLETMFRRMLPLDRVEFFGNYRTIKTGSAPAAPVVTEEQEPEELF